MSKVLIVDDEQSIRRILRDILEFEKYEVEEAVNGMDCLVKLKQKKYDVLLLDIKMPKMDGMDTLDRIQEIAPETPVVMISGHATIEDAVAATRLGAFDFMEKPLDRNRVVVCARNALERRGELALLSALGYPRAMVRRLLGREHLMLVGLGLLSGAGAALLAVRSGMPQGTVWWVAGLVAVLAGSAAVWTVAAGRIALRGVGFAALRGE